MGLLVRIDDSDTQNIEYSGDWFPSPTAVQEDFNNTLRGTTTAGSTAKFNFTGNKISVVGSVLPNFGPRTRAQFIIDNATAVEFTFPKTLQQLHRQTFYESPTMENGDHTLLIRNMRGTNSPFLLDYIEYTLKKDRPTTSPDQTPAATATTVPGSSRGALTKNDSDLVIGLSVGGAVLLVALVVLVFLCYRRRRSRRLYSDQPSVWTGCLGCCPCGRSSDDPDILWARGGEVIDYEKSSPIGSQGNSLYMKGSPPGRPIITDQDAYSITRPSPVARSITSRPLSPESTESDISSGIVTEYSSIRFARGDVDRRHTISMEIPKPPPLDPLWQKLLRPAKKAEEPVAL